MNIHEKHGKAKKTGFAFPLMFRCDADKLEEISKGWRDSMFRQPIAGDQQSLVGDTPYSVVICPELQDSAISAKFTGYEMTLSPRGSESDEDDDALLLLDVKLGSFRAKPYEGGMCDVMFTATCTINLDNEAVPALRFNEVGKVLLSLIPPTADASARSWSDGGAGGEEE